MQDEFVVTLPVYLVVYVDWNVSRYLPLGGADETGTKSVAIFTEELHAERARDKIQPLGVVWKCDTLVAFDDHLALFEAWGVEWIVFDPFLEPKSMFPRKSIRDFRRTLGT